MIAQRWAKITKEHMQTTQLKHVLSFVQRYPGLIHKIQPENVFLDVLLTHMDKTPPDSAYKTVVFGIPLPMIQQHFV